MTTALREIAFGATALLWAAGALAQTTAPGSAPPPAPRVTILTTGAGDIDLQPLRRAISAHLSPYAVEVEIVEAVPLEPGDDPSPLQSAKRTMAARDAMAVVWVDAGTEKFTALVADSDSGGWTLERSLPEDPSAWIASCDGLASLLHAALVPAFAASPAPAQDQAPRPRSEPSGADAAPGARLEAPAERRHRPKTGALGLIVNLGYGPIILNSRGDVQHGARAILGAAFPHGLELTAGVDLLFPFEAGSDAPGTGIRLVRWPVRIAPGWSYGWKKVHLGARAGLVLDFVRARGSGDEGDVSFDEGETRRTNPGLMTSLRLRADFIDEVSLFMDITADWFYRSFTYRWAGKDVLEYGAVQTSLVAGFSVQFDLI